MVRYIAILVAVIVLAAPVIAQAGCGACGGCSGCSVGAARQKAEGSEVANKTCPVMGGEVAKDTPHKAVYKGERIGFCCSGCIKEFKANPEKYYKKLDKDG